MESGARRTLLSFGQKAKDHESGEQGSRDASQDPTPRATRFTRATVKVDIPMKDDRSLLQAHHKRARADEEYASGFEEKENAYYFSYKPKYDDSNIPHVDPSYTRFKVPMEVTCRERLMNDSIRYNRQFSNEISKLIEYQNTALEAAYFVRMMSYTTLWPPYHSKLEIERTNRSFYRLSKREEARLNIIMSRDFS
ncbi:hypothetical protein KR054_011782 [Drosophila jambulina]|nr:hypothetical protein KR054_011782 [Drosophila jambulina]